MQREVNLIFKTCDFRSLTCCILMGIMELLSGYQDTVHKDKFLIMSLEVAEDKVAGLNVERLSHLWKEALPEAVMEHR